MLWNGGISFGGVVAFIFADLIIVPILNIYRRYYGARMALLLGGAFWLTAIFAGYLVELLFGLAGLIPDRGRARLPDEGVSWNYTTWLNIAFLVVAAVLVGAVRPQHRRPADAAHDGREPRRRARTAAAITTATSRRPAKGS